MNTLLGVLGTQEMLIISIALLKFGLLLILPVIIAYRLGKKKGKQEAMQMMQK